MRTVRDKIERARVEALASTEMLFAVAFYFGLAWWWEFEITPGSVLFAGSGWALADWTIYLWRRFRQ